jgi:hypothetical protein
LLKPFDQVARGGRIMLVEDNDGSYWRIQDALRGEFELTREIRPVRCCDFPTATSTS